VQSLKPFLPEKTKFFLEADLEILGHQLVFEYHLLDQEKLFELPQQNVKLQSAQIPRLDGLWQHTCFEAFLNPVGLESYYEFNFSLQPGWNCYEFTGYREPAPPKPSSDFSIQSLCWDPSAQRMQIKVENRSQFKKFRVGLTAILESKSGEKFYCATAHSGLKADFHLLKNFTITRG
jgi:hypothetical protein